MYILDSIFLLILGAVMPAFPTFIYEITENRKSYSAGEPSRLYIISLRFGGGCCLLAGIASLIVHFVI